MWHDLGAVALVVIVGAWLSSYLVRKRFPALATRLRLTAGLVGRVAAGAVFAGIGVVAAQRGGLWLLLAAVFGLLAAVSFCLVGLIVLVLIRGNAA
jgi:hypothetical protein